MNSHGKLCEKQTKNRNETGSDLSLGERVMSVKTFTVGCQITPLPPPAVSGSFLGHVLWCTKFPLND
eukprot:UN07111